MTRFMLAVAAVVCAVGTAWAGGPPPMYVVADKVTIDTAAPERVTITGTFIRLKEGPGRDYGAPVEGSITLALDEAKAAECRAEWKKWEKAAGTGRAVAVGMCELGGSLLTAKITKPGDTAPAEKVVYTPGHLGTVEKQEWEDQPPVKALLAHVKAKKVRAARP
ncbi:MAG TPA: hypothetical protein VMZ71_15900 [Gemmataceae bacterium]|nr:hypothetical protein [Gemmataceae bacterium]